MAGTAQNSEVLKAYLPRLLVNWLAEDPTTSFQELEGTLVFVDISGFTKLSERLAKKGKVGAEELSGVIGACFAQLLAVAYGNAGGLIKFGGDALLIFFSGPDHEARACRSAVGMRATLREIGRLETAGARVSLRMSVGIHSGLFHFFLAGESHRELIVTGPAASQTVVMEQTAEAGEIVVSLGTASSLPAGTLGPEKGPGWLLARPPPGLFREVADTHSEPRHMRLEEGVPLAVREHLLAGGGGPEHRQVTVAFLHFDGTDAMVASRGPEVVAEALHELVSRAQRVCDQYELAFLATDIDRDGGKIILTAGAPRSTGSDEERMLRALRQIIEADHSLPIRIGVNRGPVFAGDIGPSYRRTYTVMGDAVNLAARLMAKAESGQILASIGVLDRSPTAFEIKELEPFLVKGKAQPIRAGLVGPISGPRRTESALLGPLVGRDLELRALLEALDLAKQGVGTLVELVGEPGAGKSRLIEELKARVQDLQSFTLICDQYESSTPYFPFRLLLQVILGSAKDDRAAGHRLTELVNTMAPDLMPWLPLIAIPAGAKVPPTPETEQLDDQFRRARLHEAVGELFGRVLREPTVLIFEDTHWMDEASAELLRHLTLGVADRPWLVVTSRREQESGFLAGQGAVSVHLKSLAPEDASTLAWAATEALQLAPHEIDLLAERSGGNPLFLLELVRGAQAAGGVEALPDTVDALIMARIDRLAPGDRTRLRHAAVLGMAFREDLLTAVLPANLLDGDGVVWDRLVDFLERDHRGVYRFRHGLIREVAYEGLPYRQRRELHARAGETIERACGGRPDDEAEILSLHFFFAGEYGKAWRFSRVAGDRAQAIYANIEAGEFYQRALSAARSAGVDVTEVAAVGEALGDVRKLAAQYRKANDAYRAALRLVRGQPVAQARLLRKLSWIEDKLGRYSQALRWVARGHRVLEGRDDPPAAKERAQLSVWRAAVLQGAGRSAEALRWCERAVLEAEAAGDLDALAHAYGILDFAYVSLGREAEPFSQKALEIYERLGDLPGQAGALINLGNFAYFRGRWNEAIQFWERGRELEAKVGDPVLVAAATGNIAEVLSDQGRLDEAESGFKDALRVWTAAGDRARVGYGLGNLARVASRAGRFEEALGQFDRARTDLEYVGAQEEALAIDARVAECHMFSGEGGRALALADETLTRAQGRGAFLLPLLHRVKGYALMQEGAPSDAAEESFTMSLAAGRESGVEYEVALTLRALVDLAEARGEPAPEDLVEESAEIFRRLGVLSVPEIPLPIRA